MSPEEFQSLKCELAVKEAFAAYNDIKEMHKAYRKAWEIAGRPKEQIEHGAPFTFGCPSVLFMFWRESGELENELREIAEALPDYHRLTRGHGIGADSAMKAEAMFYAG